MFGIELEFGSVYFAALNKNKNRFIFQTIDLIY
jgi:hypothetical protein